MNEYRNCLLRQILKLKRTKSSLVNKPHTLPSFLSNLVIPSTLEQYDIKNAILRINKMLISKPPSPIVAQLTYNTVHLSFFLNIKKFAHIFKPNNIGCFIEHILEFEKQNNQRVVS